MKKVIIRILVVLAALGGLFVLVGMQCSRQLQVTEYSVPAENAQGDVRIVLLSDLHCREFGGDNEKLIKLVAKQMPDIIALDGDFIKRDCADDEISDVCEFISSLTEIAPVYFSLGNHETDYVNNNGDEIIGRIREAGAIVLECGYEDLEVNGTSFRMGGMSELAYKGGDDKYDPRAESFLTDYCDTELPTVLLSHRPEAFAFKDACKEWNVDLVLSGHTHGGLIRLPVIGGLVAPIQGLFPRFYYGEYNFYDTTMIITSGLAGYYWAPRMFNPPEICVVTLTAKG